MYAHTCMHCAFCLAQESQNRLKTALGSVQLTAPSGKQTNCSDRSDIVRVGLLHCVEIDKALADTAVAPAIFVLGLAGVPLLEQLL